MKVIQLIWGVVILFISFSCTNNTEIYKSDIPDGSINMRFNVQERVSDNLLLEIVELTDSRCPVGSVCNNAGFVKVGFRVFSNEGISTTTMLFSDFGYGDQNVDTIMGHSVEMVKVTPYPFKDEPLEDPENYTISIKVQEL
jgi:hypothetical protein